MNWMNIPTITVCHLIAFRFLEVAHMTNMMTASPKSETARLARVLSWLSGLAKAPMRRTAMTKTALRGVLSVSGIKPVNRTAEFIHRTCIGFVTIVMGMWKKRIRKVMANQTRNAFNHPVLEPLDSCIPWMTRPAIHQLEESQHCICQGGLKEY